MCQEVGGRTSPSRELICFSIPLGQEVILGGVGRSPRDEDRLIALHLVKEGIDASNNMLATGLMARTV